jgi:hypothetical protein
MKFGDITRANASLRMQVNDLEKNASVVGKAFGAVGSGIGRAASVPVRLAGRAAWGGAKAVNRFAWNSAQRLSGGNKLLGGVFYTGGLLGTGAVAKKSIQQARQYRQGFDPRVQAMQSGGMQ